MPDKVPLSVVILAKNEASRIADCLASVRWADDILVVDDESTDETVAIAESLGARVLRRKMDLEGRHRNWAYAQARHEWVLSLDADERVTPELASEIRALLANGTSFETYAIPRRNYIGDYWVRHGGWYPSAQMKLFKRSVFRWEETTVHPRAISDRPWGTLQHDLTHYSYRDFRDFVEKMNRQTTLEAEKWLADARHVPFVKALWRTVDRFIRSYVGKRGFRDGVWGFVVAVMAGMYQFLAWAKYWERRRVVPIEDVVAPFESLAADQERYDRELLMSHLCAYQVAGHRGREKRILEIGCGRGYGAFYLGHVAREVIAIDLNRALIDQANRLFRRANVRYLPMEAARLALQDGTFDMVGTFQVIEHLPERDLPVLLRELARVLAPGGQLVASTLNLDHNRKGNPQYQKPSFHEKEFSPEEFRALLESVFPVVQVYGLYPSLRHRIFRRLKKWGFGRWGDPRRNVVQRFYRDLTTRDFRLRPRCTSGAIDLIGICRKAPRRDG